MKAVLATIASDPAHPGLKRLRETAHAWGWRLLELPGPWNGWGARLKTILAKADRLYIEEGVTHVVSLDAYDTFACGPPEELEAALAGYGDPPVLAAVEGACWPDQDLAVQYPERKQNWWYAHSQFVFNATKPRPPGFGELEDFEDDQRHITKLFLAGTPGIVLEYGCRVIQSLAHSNPPEQWFSWDGDRLVNKTTGSRPLTAHLNGGTDPTWFEPHLRRAEVTT